MSDRIGIALGARSYDVHVGANLIDDAGSLLAPFARGPVALVTDKNVAAVHLDRALAAFRGHVDVKPIVLEPGEGTKSFHGLERLIEDLLTCGIERDGLVVALGGGVIGDLAGFASGVLKRGVGYAQIPTTLLAQVDSSIGGKTGINTNAGKNLVGLFHQPRSVIADTTLLSTLPRRELVSGYAEVAKYGALGDASFFAWLENHASAALGGEQQLLEQMVANCVRMKAAIVARDERESGERALLNLGHTFGHALEAATGYSGRLVHGEAVAIGMVLAFQLSAALGLAPAADAERIERHLRNESLPVRIADIPGPHPDADAVLTHMMHDKKMKRGRPAFVLVRGLGRAFSTSDVPLPAVRALLAR